MPLLRQTKEKKLKQFRLCLLVILLVLVSIPLWAKGLSLSPSEYFWENIAIGKQQKCPASIMIQNDSDVTRSFVLRVVLPDEMKLKPKDGYVELPDTQWVSFDNKIVSIGAKQWKQIHLFVDIPMQKQNRNKKWEFYLEVKEYTSGLEFFILGCYSRFFMETAKK